LKKTGNWGVGMDCDLVAQAQAVLDVCRSRKLTIATAESCTGGLLAATLTDIPGSSEVFDRGFVTYSNAAKEAMLGVPSEVLARHGAVSRATAEAMVAGTLANSGVHLAVSITGIAGPGGGLPDKPVGLVHFAATSDRGQFLHQECRFGDIGRSQVRRASVIVALRMLLELAQAR